MSKDSWIIEREQAVKALHDVCGSDCDNDKLSLIDVIEKHLIPYLEKILKESEAWESTARRLASASGMTNSDYLEPDSDYPES